MKTTNPRTIHSVFAAFKLMDDFTGKAITDPSTSFFINNQRVLPIRKTDGIFVLTDLNFNFADIIIQSPYYCQYTVNNFSTLTKSGSDKIIPIRLHTGLNYPLKPGTTAYSAQFVSNSGKPLMETNIQLFVPFSNNSVKFKAVKTVNGVKAILVTNPKGYDLTGLALVVSPVKPSTQPIIFNIISKIDNMTFEVAAPTKDQKPPEESILKRVYSSFTNNHGEVLIPMEVTHNSNDPGSPLEAAIELYIPGTEPKELFIKLGSLTHFKEVIKGGI